MTIPLLATKFSLPVRRVYQVPRPHLVRRLDDGLRFGHRLTLVSAPAGYGKTTLLAEWISEKGNIAWLSLDEGDNDPALFLMYVVAALQKVEGDIGITLQSLMRVPQLPPVETLATSLVNDIASVPKSFVLILDDYHLIQTESIHAALSFFIEHQPSNLHSVILSREDPPLPLSRLRARGELTEIREQDLCFSVGEAESFLNQTMGLSLTDEMIATLEDQTEGWIAGLQLAALSLQNREDPEDFISLFKGEDRYIMDYLVEEVLSRQPQPIQDFLLQTSILERMSAPLCDAVLCLGLGEHEDTGDDPFSLKSRLLGLPANNSQRILEYLDHNNLFLVPLDNRREWYRYHRLFADLLRYRLERTAPDQLLELHRRASRWYAQVGEIDAAMWHALAAPDYLLAAELAEQYAMRLIGGSRLATFLSWMGRGAVSELPCFNWANWPV